MLVPQHRSQLSLLTPSTWHLRGPCPSTRLRSVVFLAELRRAALAPHCGAAASCPTADLRRRSCRQTGAPPALQAHAHSARVGRGSERNGSSATAQGERSGGAPEDSRVGIPLRMITDGPHIGALQRARGKGRVFVWMRFGRPWLRREEPAAAPARRRQRCGGGGLSGGHAGARKGPIIDLI